MSSSNFENEQSILESCAMAYTVSLIGGRWKSTILWQLLNSGKRYKQLKETIPNISDRMLTSSLRELEQDGLISKITQADFPPKTEYKLTGLGATMGPILKSMSEWGRQNKVPRQSSTENNGF